MYKKHLILILVFVLVLSSVVLAQESKKYEGVTIRMGAWETGGSVETINLLPEFEKLTGIKVKIELMGDPVLQEKQYIDLMSGTGYYDIINMHYWYVTPYGESKLIENLEPYLENRWGTYLDLDDMFKAPMDMGIGGDGNRYTLPFYQHAGCIMYRKDLFSDYGVNVPVTMEDLEKAAEKLTIDSDGNGSTDIYGIAMRGIGGPDNPHMYWGWLSGWDGYVLDKETFEPTVNSSGAVTALEVYSRLLQKFGPPGVSTWHYPPVEQIYESEKCSMILDATDFFPRIESYENIRGKTGYDVMPLTPIGKRPNFAYTAQLGINSGSKNKEAAWLFMQWLLSPDIQIRTALKGIRGDMPSRRAWQNEEYIEKYPFLPDILKAMEISDSSYIPKVKELLEIAEPVGNAFSEAIAGINTPKAALDIAAEKIKGIMEKAGYYK